MMKDEEFIPLNFFLLAGSWLGEIKERSQKIFARFQVTQEMENVRCGISRSCD
jgi:hypothetical protein